MGKIVAGFMMIAVVLLLFGILLESGFLIVWAIADLGIAGLIAAWEA